MFYSYDVIQQTSVGFGTRLTVCHLCRGPRHLAAWYMVRLRLLHVFSVVVSWFLRLCWGHLTGLAFSGVVSEDVARKALPRTVVVFAMLMSSRRR